MLSKSNKSSSSSVFDKASAEFLNRLRELKTQESAPDAVQPVNYFQMAIEEPKTQTAVVIRQPGTAKQRFLNDAEKRQAHREEMQEKLRAFRETQRIKCFGKVRVSKPGAGQKIQDEDTPSKSPPKRASIKTKEVKGSVVVKKPTKAGLELDKFQLDLVESSIGKTPYHRTRSPTPNVKNLLAKMGKTHHITEVHVPAKRSKPDHHGAVPAGGTFGRCHLNQTPRHVRTVNTELPINKAKGQTQNSPKAYTPSPLSCENSPVNDGTSVSIPIISLVSNCAQNKMATLKPSVNGKLPKATITTSSSSSSSSSSSGSSSSSSDSSSSSSGSCSGSCCRTTSTESTKASKIRKIKKTKKVSGIKRAKSSSCSYSESSRDEGGTDKGKDDYEKFMAFYRRKGVTPVDPVYGDKPRLITLIRGTRKGNKHLHEVIYSSVGCWMGRLKAAVKRQMKEKEAGAGREDIKQTSGAECKEVAQKSGDGHKEDTQKSDYGPKEIKQTSGTGRKEVSQKSDAGRKKVTQKSSVGRKKIKQTSGTGRKEVTQKSSAGREKIKQTSGTGRKEVSQKSDAGRKEVTQKSSVGRKKVTQKSVAGREEIKQTSGDGNMDVTKKSGVVLEEIKESSGAGRVDIMEISGTGREEIKEISGAGNKEVTQKSGVVREEIKESSGSGREEIKEISGAVREEIKRKLRVLVTKKSSKLRLLDGKKSLKSQ